MPTGTITDPMFTWNLILTGCEGVVLGLLIRRWFSVMNEKAEERYQQYVKAVNGKQDIIMCEKIHTSEDEQRIERQRYVDERHEELKCDIKEIKKSVNSILTHLTGIQH